MIVVQSINKSINAYLDARNVALMIWKLALASVNVIGLDQIVLKVSVLTREAVDTFPQSCPFFNHSERARERKRNAQHLMEFVYHVIAGSAAAANKPNESE